MTKKKEENEPVEVAVYDRDMLQSKEVQPIATEDGHVIFVDNWGKFGAKVVVGDSAVLVSEPTLETARDKVHKNHLALKRKKNKKILAVPAFIYENQGSYWGADPGWWGEAFFRGVHSRTGELQYAKPDGSKEFGEGIYVFHRDDPACNKIAHLSEQIVDLRTQLSELQDELRPIIDAQREKMWAGSDQDQRYSSRPRPRTNDAQSANEIAEIIVANILKPKGEEK